MQIFIHSVFWNSSIEYEVSFEIFPKTSDIKSNFDSLSNDEIIYETFA